VAALPLITAVKRRLVACMDVPGNEWSSAGQLLLDPHCDAESVCDRLVDTLQTFACPAFWFASIPIEADWWRAFMAAGERAGWSVDARRRYQVGRLPLEPTWTAQQQAMSKGLRKQIRRSLRRIELQGALRLHVARPSRGDTALGLLESGLALEHAGWKGRQGSSVLAHDTAWHYIQDQARQLIPREQFVVALLELGGRIVAFEYGWIAKQVYHSYKVSYDEELRSCGPGNLMNYKLLEYLHSLEQVRTVDFLGPLDQSIRRWRPHCYWMGRLLMAPPKPVGRALVFASRYLLTGNTSPLVE
jgi:hypothetical protein